MKQAIRLLATCGALVAAAPAAADRPPRPLLPVSRVCSWSGAVCAVVDRRVKTTTVFRGKVVLWSMQGAPASLSVSDDGRSLIEQYHGANLLDLQDGLDTPLLVFRDQGRVVRRVLVRDFVSSLAALPRSVSHRVWARVYGLGRDNRFFVDTPDGRRFIFELPSAQVTGGAAPQY